MRTSILAAIAILGASVAANANCDDTLYLQAITVYRQSSKNDTLLGAWDSTTVNPWSLSDLPKAGPVGASVAGFGADTVRHYLRFSSDCGTDSIANVLVATVRDSLVVAGNVKSHLVTADTVVKPFRVQRIGDGVGTVTLQGSTGSYALTYLWEAKGSFQIGQTSASSPIEGWTSLTHSYEFSSSSVSSNGLLESVGPVRAIALDNLGSFLSGRAAAVRSVGKALDSVRTDLALYRYSYGKSMPVISPNAILPRGTTKAGMSVRSLAAGVEIRLGSPASVQILSLNGRVERTLGYGTTQAWDGRDLTGRRLSGLWIVRAEGLGSQTVLLR